jgi:RHS repeat-associated protein
MPNLEELLPYRLHFFFPEAQAAETQVEESSQQTSEQEETQVPDSEAAPAPEGAAVVTSEPADPFLTELQMQSNPEVSFSIDDYKGGAHFSYPIVAPPARSKLSPNLSLNYNSRAPNGWIGVGWDLPLGYIQRRGPRKGVPKYNDTLDVFELKLGGKVPQHLVPIGGGEYRLRIEGDYLKIKYYPANYWEVWDKSGIKMRFGYTAASRIGRVRDPNLGTDTYRWCLDRIEDPKTNYMNITYFRDQDANKTYQIYLQKIQYNGQDSGGFSTNHEILFTLESTDRPDPIYNYRGGFKNLTKKRLSWIEIRTNGNLVRKYRLQYTVSNSHSLLSSVTHYGKDGTSTLPPTNFYYQTNATGFQPGTSWPNPSGLELTNHYPAMPNEIRNILNQVQKGTWSDVIDMNGDGLPDRLVARIANPNNYKMGVYLNNGSGFNQKVDWSDPAGKWGEGYIRHVGNGEKDYGIIADLIDLNGDGLPDRVVYDTDSQFPPFDTWTVYFNNGSGFDAGVSWSNPSGMLYTVHQPATPNAIRNIDSYGTWSDVIDMNGDGLPDRVVAITISTLGVYLNNGSGFDQKVNWSDPAGSWGGAYIRYIGQGENDNGIIADLIDLNGDGLPDRVVYDTTSPYDTWTVYFNKGSGFDAGVSWPNPSGTYYSPYHQAMPNAIRNVDDYGTWSDQIDVNGDGLPDRMVAINTTTIGVYFNNGSGFNPKVNWSDPAGTLGMGYIRYIGQGENDYGIIADLIDLNGDGLPDRVIYDTTSPFDTWTVYFNNGSISDLLYRVDTEIGGRITIAYRPSTDYDNTGGDGKWDLPFIVQTVSSYMKEDGRGNIYTYEYDYAGGFYDPTEVEFRGFGYVKVCQPNCDPQLFEWKKETWYHQDYFKKGKIQTQLTTSKEGHTKQIDNDWQEASTAGGGKFPYLDGSSTTITDVGFPPHTLDILYEYDFGTLNMIEEHKYGTTLEEEIHTYFTYTNCPDQWIFSKPTSIKVTGSGGTIFSQKWMDYTCTTGNLTKEEVCKSDNPTTGCLSRNESQNSVTSYEYDDFKNLWKITDPRGYQTILTYESTKTHVYNTQKCLDVGSCTSYHLTTTEYYLETGDLKKLIPPHLQGTTYSTNYTYDVFGRKTLESRPDGGWTSYQYINFGNPNTQYVEKKEHIIGGPSVIDHYTFTLFDGLGRTYWLEKTGPGGKRIITETWYDAIGRVLDKSNPYYYGIDTPYYTTFTYDGLSRVIDILTPDNYHISTAYQGLKKVVTNQRGYSTAYTYDVHQRLKKVEDPYGTITEYSYDTLGNLIQVIAAKGNTEQNTTTMTYDSLSKKRTMTDPDMGYWTYQYDKSGNLTSQTDAKSQTITFTYDGLNRLTQKVYPDRTVTYTYDDVSVPYSKGKLTKVSDPLGGETKEDFVLEYDLMQRIKKNKKKIGVEEVTFEKSYDSAGKVITIKYLAGTPNEKTYGYEYDVAGNLLYIKDNASGTHLVDYSDFTARGQQQIALFPKPNNVSVKSTYTYYPETGRLHTLLTQKWFGGSPVETYQNLDYQHWDGKGNLITQIDNLNGITHGYTYDSLDRLITANGTGTNPYSQSYGYDRIGNITYKSDVGSYSYTYSSKPHAVRSAGSITLQYDLNGNMIQRAVSGGITLDITYNYDNKPDLIKKNSANYVQLTYDGNAERVKKYNYTTGQTILYFGELYEIRGGAGTIYLFAGNNRVVSVFLDGTTQFYHPNHLGSASVVTDQNGLRKEQMEYFPFGAYRAVGVPTGTYDFDPNFPDVFYTFTGQEDDDDLGLYNFKARLYDPVLGRFISPDPIIPDPTDLQSFNRYSYVKNNPLRYIDPTGNEPGDPGEGGPDLGPGTDTGWGTDNCGGNSSSLAFLEAYAIIFNNQLKGQEPATPTANSKGLVNTDDPYNPHFEQEPIVLTQVKIERSLPQQEEPQFRTLNLFCYPQTHWAIVAVVPVFPHGYCTVTFAKFGTETVCVNQSGGIFSVTVNSQTAIQAPATVTITGTMSGDLCTVVDPNGLSISVDRGGNIKSY